MTPPLHSANARKMVNLLLHDDGREKTGAWLIEQGVTDPRGTADALKRAGYHLHIGGDGDWDLVIRYTLLGRQGALAV